MNGKKSPRIRDQELVLRIIALYVDDTIYRRPLKTYLNKFVSGHRTMKDFDKAAVRIRFESAELLAESVGKDGLRLAGYQINAALAEAVFVGLMRRLSSDPNVTPTQVAGAVDRLRLSLGIGPRKAIELTDRAREVAHWFVTKLDPRQ